MRKPQWVAMFLCVAFLCGCTPETNRKTGFYFDTTVAITIYGADNSAATDACFALFSEWDSLWNRFDPSSELSRINSGALTEPDTLTMALIMRAFDYNRQTDGLFDVALGTLSSAWGFGSAAQAVPEDSLLKSALAASGMAHVSAQDGTISLANGAQLDFGSIAKGMAADAAAQTLRDHGVTAAIIDLGGNIVCVGGRTKNEPFIVGIQRPFAPPGEAAATVEVRDAGVVTSGIYQRYFTQEGKLYPHIIDPRTGLPCDSDLASVTVIAGSAEWADALSTALLLLGSARGFEFVKDRADTEAVFITKDGNVLYTPGLEGNIKIR